MREKTCRKAEYFLIPFALLQGFLGIRVVLRLLRSAGGERLSAPTAILADENEGKEAVTVIVPVLNEYQRLAPCLQGLMIQGRAVAEIVVVDGGSCDGTQELVRTYEQQDSRIRLVDASPVPSDWNGKVWGLQVGLCSACPATSWILTMDADVRPGADLVSALLARAKRDGLAALSLATLQEIHGIGEGLLHPAFLTTLVYRFGIPGKIVRHVREVQANGQCFLFCRKVLETCSGFAGTRHSLSDDVTMARLLVAQGYAFGFYEAGDLAVVRMYQSGRETWNNWARSLPMHDHFSGMSTLSGYLEMMLVQALPLPLFLFLVITRSHCRWLFVLNGVLVAMRIGILFGTMRAYNHRPWSYWLSPLCDLPVVCKLGRSVLQRRHYWRGRVLERGGKA